MTKKLIHSGLILAAIVSFCSNALACIQCVTEDLDYVLPRSVIWWLFWLAWYWLLSIELSVAGKKFPLMRPLIATSLVLLSLFFGAAIGIGVFLAIPIALICLAWLGSVIYQFIKTRQLWNLAYNLGLMGSVGSVLLIFLIYLTINTRIQRTDLEYYCAHPYSAYTSRYFNQLKTQEPASLGEYRNFVLQNSFYLVWRAADRIGEIGNPTIDVPLLIQVLRKFQGDSKFANQVKIIEYALKKLSDLDLPEGTSADAWELAWNNQTQKKTPNKKTGQQAKANEQKIINTHKKAKTNADTIVVNGTSALPSPATSSLEWAK